MKRRGLCFQFLYPGAKIKDMKHSEGRFQRDYTCWYPSHNKFPTNKYVLVCREHKDQKKINILGVLNQMYIKAKTHTTAWIL